MDVSADFTTFAPGQPVFFQGEFRQEFFGLRQGRFAKVKLNDTNPEIPMADRLASATLLEIFDQPGQIFGELDALLNKPHEFSVFALEESDAMPIPISEKSFHRAMTTHPHIGVKACISLARSLHAAIDRFTRLVHCEEELHRLHLSSARALISATTEIEQIGTGASAAIATALQFARSHKAFELAARISTENLVRMTTESLSNAFIPLPNIPGKVREFSIGTIICRKGVPGDRLFILTRGEVDVVFSPSHRIRVDRPGSILGEIATLQNLDNAKQDTCRTADVVCATPVSAIVIELGQVYTFFGLYPGILTNLMFALVNRMEQMMKPEASLRNGIYYLLEHELRHFLEAHHGVALRLDNLCIQDPALERPCNACADQSRQIYNAYSTALDLLKRH